MIIKTDFITNSSSSNYVIGKKYDVDVDINYVFNLLKSFYKEYL